MRNEKGLIVLLLITALFGFVAVFLGIQLEHQETRILSVELVSNEKIERINCWEDDTGSYYVFLPSYADLSVTKICLNTSMPVWLDGRQLCDGDICERFQLNVPYELSYIQQHKMHKTTLKFMKSADVATMYIETPTKSMDYIHAQKGNEETGTISLYDSMGILNYQDNQISIKGRGNATWTDSEKKSYSVDLLDAADLLGMGTANRWILLANGLDQSNLRNKIVYEFANKIGLAYSPESRWVDLYLNGEYAGLYLLCERNEVHSERVDISYGNSFLLSSELEYRLIQQDYPYILTNTKLAMRIHYPEVVTEDSKMVLTAKWQAIENAVLAENGIDPETGKSWQELIDIDSWARKYLIDEVFGNLDAYLISQYYYIDGNEVNGKVYSGPVWDYDATIGNLVTWQLENPYSFFVGRLKFKPGVDTTLIYTLSKKDEFRKRIEELYLTEIVPEMEALLTQEIYAYTAEIEKAAAMNKIRWSIEEDILYHRDYLVDYLSKRNSFLYSMWVEDVEYHQVLIDQGVGTIYAHFAVPSGTCLAELPRFKPTPYQDPTGLWYYADTGEPFDITKPITEDIEIYTTWVDNASKREGQIAKLLPLCVIAVIGLGLLWIEVNRWKRRR